MSAPSYTPFPVAVAIDPGLDDDVALKFGTGDDVALAFDGTALAFTDSGGDDILTLDPATSLLELSFPGASVAGDFPALSMFRDEASAGLGALDPFGAVSFVGLNSASERTTYARVQGRYVFGLDSAECGNLALQVMHNGTLTDMLTVQGDTSGAGIDIINCATSLTFTTAGDALLVNGNQAAFRFSGGLSAGFFFMTGQTAPGNGFEFRDATGAVSGRITTDGIGGMLVRPGTTTSARGFDTTAAGQLNLARNTATLVKCWADLEMDDAENIILATTTGTKIGTATTQKLGFYNATPITQPAGAGQAAMTNSTGGTADGTLAAVSGTGDDATINDNFTDVYTALTAFRTALVNLGLIKGAA